MASVSERWSERGDLRLRELLLNSQGCASPFGLTDEGLCDFRGLTIDDSLHGVVIQEADFSNAKMGRGQLMASLRECRFVEFACDGALGEDFVCCDFRGAHLTNALLYGKFVRCDFTNADLAGVRGRYIRFEECNFEGTNFRRASFYDSTFLGCKIKACRFGSGSLAGSRFESCALTGADFGTTIMTRVVGVV